MKLNSEQLAAISDDELANLITDLVGRKAHIDDEVSFARRNFAATGESEDPDWLCRAETASRLTGRDIRVLMNEQGRRSRAKKAIQPPPNPPGAKAARKAALQACFMEAAHDMLPAATFEAILTSAGMKAMARAETANA